MDALPSWAWVLIVLSLVAVAWLLHLAFWTRRLRLDLPYDDELELDAPDGGRFVLRRLRGASPGHPVLLVHGVAANHRNLDAHPEVSLARHLAAEGRDVWLLTLRSGMRGRRGPVRFDAMARHDVPRTIARVLELTEASSLDYVGFSMGGMLLYAGLARGHVQSERLRRVVIVGSPGRVVSPLAGLGLLVRIPSWLVPTFPLRAGARGYAFAVDLLHTPLHRLVYNPKNLAPRHAAHALVNVIEDIPAGLNADLAAMLRAGEVRCEGSPVLADLAEVKVPALFLAGAADGIAPPHAVRAAFEAWGAEDKRFEVIGRESGADHDFGHGDLAVGHSAVVEVFPRVAAFLG
ncbi:MAG: alpha/beta fold hydrolase [Sandaracinus sp.]|nr:alpha/beta fold hydrolase [Sandaracinus sp.]MCB9613554.1 alpha/beta fold hydrolase [Sandaracinus sp.]MCB9632541.1 alpha/beta fold hydrolase [Sandaracinus sp.]